MSPSPWDASDRAFIRPCEGLVALAYVVEAQGAPYSAYVRSAETMTNRIAIVLGAVLLGLILLDVLLFRSENLVFLGKKMFDLIEWMAFWR